YLIPKEGKEHWYLVEGNDSGLIGKALDSIKNKISLHQHILEKLQEWQPDHEQFKSCHDELMRKERNHKFFGMGIGTLLCAWALKDCYHMFITQEKEKKVKSIAWAALRLYCGASCAWLGYKGLQGV